MATALPAIGIGLTFASGAFQGIAANRAASYQAAIASQNQRIAQQNAVRAQQTAQVEQQDQDTVARAMLGEQLAQQGASGLSIGSGSFRLARKSAQELARKDALNIRHAGDVEAHNYLVQAANFGSQAQASRMEGSNALLSGFLEGASGAVGDYNLYGGTGFPSLASLTRKTRKTYVGGGIGHM